MYGGNSTQSGKGNAGASSNAGGSDSGSRRRKSSSAASSSAEQAASYGSSVGSSLYGSGSYSSYSGTGDSYIYDGSFNYTADQDAVSDDQLFTPPETIEATIVKMIEDNNAEGKETGLGEIGSRLVKIFPDFEYPQLSLQQAFGVSQGSPFSVCRKPGQRSLGLPEQLP